MRADRMGDALARMFHESMSRDRPEGRATGQSSRGTAGLVPRRTCTPYVAGADARGGSEGRPALIEPPACSAA
jgi:hypothetical protein